MTGRPPARRPSAVVRPVVATTQVVASGAVAHASAGGGLPGAEVLLPMVAMVGLVSGGLRRGLLRPGPAVAIVTAGQLLLHAAGSTPVGHGAHAASTATSSVAGDMVLAHAVSAVVTVMALLWQEQAVLAVARWLAPFGRHLPPLPRRSHSVSGCDLVVATPVRLLALAPRRGPPAVSSAVAC